VSLSSPALSRGSFSSSNMATSIRPTRIPGGGGSCDETSGRAVALDPARLGHRYWCLVGDDRGMLKVPNNTASISTTNTTSAARSQTTTVRRNPATIAQRALPRRQMDSASIKDTECPTDEAHNNDDYQGRYPNHVASHTALFWQWGGREPWRGPPAPSSAQSFSVGADDRVTTDGLLRRFNDLYRCARWQRTRLPR
jgi:hypothetical protein